MLFTLFSQISTALATDLALYWGQASAGSQQSLGSYCANSPGDIYIISFINSFGSGNAISMNIAGYYNYFSGTSLLNAPELGSEIEQCQSLGKKVLISLGGAAGNYGFSSESDAENVAEELWNYFGGGSSSTRPFGAAKIDGFDLDGENNVDAYNYVPFVNKLRQLYATDSSKQYYVSAAPQCPFPDATTGQAIAQADLDFLFVQFYNNYCSLTGNNFNFDTWQNFATSSSPNKNVKIYVGLAGSPTAAGSGYATIDQIKAKRSEFENDPNFGGFMVWDASQANSNIIDGQSFAQQLKDFGGAAAPAAPAAPAAITTSTTAAPVAPVTSVAPVAPETSAVVPVAPVTSAPAPVAPVTSVIVPVAPVTSAAVIASTSSVQQWAALTSEALSASTVIAPPVVESTIIGAPTWVPVHNEVTQTLVFTSSANCTTSSDAVATTPVNEAVATHAITPEAAVTQATTSEAAATQAITSVASTTAAVSGESANTNVVTSTTAVVAAFPKTDPVVTAAHAVTTSPVAAAQPKSSPVYTTTLHANYTLTATIAKTSTITSETTPPAQTLTSTGGAITTTTNGVVIVYETVYETEYTTKYECSTQTVTVY